MMDLSGINCLCHWEGDFTITSKILGSVLQKLEAFFNRVAHGSTHNLDTQFNRVVSWWCGEGFSCHGWVR